MSYFETGQLKPDMPLFQHRVFLEEEVSISQNDQRQMSLLTKINHKLNESFPDKTNKALVSIGTCGMVYLSYYAGQFTIEAGKAYLASNPEKVLIYSLSASVPYSLIMLSAYSINSFRKRPFTWNKF
jgi:hypothetical protein